MSNRSTTGPPVGEAPRGDPAAQSALTRWAPKAPLDFAALIEEQTQTRAYARLRCPVLVMRGEHAPAPTRLIAEALPSLLPDARLAVIAGAGHMGPMTHTADVNTLIVQHLTGTEVRRLAPPALAARANPLPTQTI